MRALAELVAPTVCVACGAGADEDLCGACAHDLDVVAAPWCMRCGTPGVHGERCDACRAFTAVGRVRSLVVYRGPAKSLTMALKRRGPGRLAADMADPLAALLTRDLSPHVVTWVPSGRRRREMGFDHAELLARRVARAAGLPVRRLLVRRAEGRRQADVDSSQRRTNVRDRFAAHRCDGHVVVVDDVFTTGATVDVCAELLRDAGATAVEGLTWARTLRRFRR